MYVNVTLDVTEKDIEEGYIKDCKRCPIALALKRILNSEIDFKVYTYHIYVNINIGYHFGSIYFVGDVQQFILDFDNDPSSVKPRQFTLSIPEEYLLK